MRNDALMLLLLNALDGGLTYLYVAHWSIPEVNPAMSLLLGAHAGTFLAFKLVVVSAFIGILYAGRKARWLRSYRGLYAVLSFGHALSLWGANAIA